MTCVWNIRNSLAYLLNGNEQEIYKKIKPNISLHLLTDLYLIFGSQLSVL
jgi:hypothetical protein